MIIMVPFRCFDKVTFMQTPLKHLTTLLQKMYIFELINFGVFFTGLSLMFAFSSTGGIVDRMELAYQIPRAAAGAIIVGGAVLMGISTHRWWKFIGWIPYALCVAGVWGMTPGYAWQAVIVYSIHALVLLMLILQADNQS